MNNTDAIRLFAVIAALYPREAAFASATEESIRAWAYVLADVPYKVAEAAVKAHATTSPFPPTIADIKGWIAKINNPQMDAGEAWGIVQAAIRKHRRYGKDKAKAELPAEVWTLVERIGWHEICTTESIEVVRGQFMRMWDTTTKRKQEQAALPQAIRASIAQISAKVAGEIEA